MKSDFFGQVGSTAAGCGVERELGREGDEQGRGEDEAGGALRANMLGSEGAKAK